MPVQTNLLIHEKSPYLLQHAHNPVDWRPWGEAAFEKARREGKPIFLSIGYSTCHWCHVMAHESFESDAVAAVLNAHFVAIKVDREERPDVDKVYMTYVQATTGGGGWPLSVWLTPDLKPFLGGTYYPPEDRWGRIGFRVLLQRIAAAWADDREKIAASADHTIQRLRHAVAAHPEAAARPEAEVLEAGYRQIQAEYDPLHGGFGEAPKFPRPVTLEFLLRHHQRTGVQEARDMALGTLRKMANGGMHDQLGGGFHRYSVDTFWHVPHFEKMLYDQAQLANAYLDAFQLTRDASFAEVARDVLDYVLRDLTGKDGQFHSAEDADSPLPGDPAKHAEGAFYVWELQEIVDALGRETAELFATHFGVESKGNAPDGSDPQGEFQGKNILIVRHPLEETARQFGLSPDMLRARLSEASATLWRTREQRPRPHLDDKTLTAWNGLMISALARAAQVLDEPRYRTAAQRAAGFVQTRLYNADAGTLRRRYRQGDAAIEGFADDYAFLIRGLLDLYEADSDSGWLRWAMTLQRTQDVLFWDEADGGYFSTTGTDPSVILRDKEAYDGAEPAPNSVAALNLLRLARIGGNADWQVRAERLFATFGARLRRQPSAMPHLLGALGFQLAAPRQIVLAGDPGAPDTRALLREVQARFLPNKVLLFADGGAGQAWLAEAAPCVRELVPLQGRATAYVCEDFVCRLPVTEPAALGALLDAPETTRH